MGQEVRFKDPKKSKGKVFVTPSPSAYDLRQHWPAKKDAKNTENKKNFMDKITKGVAKSIYYN